MREARVRARGAELAGRLERAMSEPNIHDGVKYIKQLMTTYVADDNMTKTDRVLFAFASYNAGPARIRQLRREAERRGLNPNVWFGQVEQVVSARGAGTGPGSRRRVAEVIDTIAPI